MDLQNLRTTSIKEGLVEAERLVELVLKEIPRGQMPQELTRDLGDGECRAVPCPCLDAPPLSRLPHVVTRGGGAANPIDGVLRAAERGRVRGGPLAHPER